MFYYLVELQDLVLNEIYPILIKEENLGNFISNLLGDYIILNIYGLGKLNLEYEQFLKKDEVKKEEEMNR